METATRHAPDPGESLPAFAEAAKEQEGRSPLRAREAKSAQSGRALTRRFISQAQFKAVVGLADYRLFVLK
ncbi:MAG: hypothetical protein HYU31_00365 [Deltaproteobacteria bacterium]|nr:hypothetical protein [Deltaproteobacteria bacterium]